MNWMNAAAASSPVANEATRTQCNRLNIYRSISCCYWRKQNIGHSGLDYVPLSPEVNQRWTKHNKRQHYIRKDVQIQNKHRQNSQPSRCRRCKLSTKVNNISACSKYEWYVHCTISKNWWQISANKYDTIKKTIAYRAIEIRQVARLVYRIEPNRS